MAVSLRDALPWNIADSVDRSLRPTDTDNSVTFDKSTDDLKLVVLLGWGGALQKHLSRIRQFYIDERYAVVSYISPMSCFLCGGLIEKDIAELAKIIQRELPRVRQKTFHVHLHSNNGTFVWGALLLALQEFAPEALPALTSVVLDSAPRMDPKPPNLLMQAIGFTFPCIPILLRRNQYVHPVWTPALFFYFLLKLLWMRMKPLVGGRFGFAQVREAVLCGMPAATPQLYIYSTKDKLISSAAVEDFISKQRTRGVQVSAKLFTDTPHVQHFLRKEAEYKDALQKFLNAT